MKKKLPSAKRSRTSKAHRRNVKPSLNLSKFKGQKKHTGNENKVRRIPGMGGVKGQLQSRSAQSDTLNYTGRRTRTLSQNRPYLHLQATNQR